MGQKKKPKHTKRIAQEYDERQKNNHDRDFQEPQLLKASTQKKKKRMNLNPNVPNNCNFSQPWPYTQPSTIAKC